jgi:hypothetical protein
MEDSVRPSAEAFADCYAKGYRAWKRLYQKAAASPHFPADLVDFEHAFPGHPYLHSNLELKPGYNYLATGTSTWLAAGGGDNCNLQPFQRPYSVPVTAHRPIALSIVSSESPEQFPTWFGPRGNHLCILTLAWAYVLSARWAEIVPGATAPEYTDHSAIREDSGTKDAGRCVRVDLGPASDDASRWWAAVLAPYQGWTTGIRHEDGLRPAPWSTNLAQKDGPFLLSRAGMTKSPLSHDRPPSFSAAASYISAYAAHHGKNQSRAAFAAALMLPSASRIKRTISLPGPRLKSDSSCCNNGQSANLVPEAALSGDDVHQLDRLLTLSCNNFVQSLLSSVIF